MQVTREKLDGMLAGLRHQERAALDKAAGARGAIQAVEYLIALQELPEAEPEPKAASRDGHEWSDYDQAPVSKA